MGLVVSVMGTWMQMTAQGWLVYDLKQSPLYLGLVGVCGTLPVLLFSLPAGVLADRVPKRNILLVTQSAALVQAFVLAGLTFGGVVRVWHVMVLAGILGTVNAFDMPTRHSMVIELASREDLLNAVSLNSSAFNTGRIVGPMAAGVMIAAFGTAICFLVNGLTFVALIAALAVIRPRNPDRKPTGPMAHEIRLGLSWVRGHEVARSVLVMIAITSVFAMSYQTLLPAFARDVFHAGPKGLGFMVSAYAIGALSSAVTLTALGHRWRLGQLMTMGSFIFPVALLGVAAAPKYEAALASLFLAGAGLMLFNAVANTILQKAPPDELRGRVMSLRTLLFAGMVAIGNLQVGAVGQWFGPRAAVAVGAAICLLAAFGAWWRAPAVRASE
jgi:MFS family permease